MNQSVRGVVSGEFWPQCPWEVTTAEGTVFGSSGWRLLPDHKNIIEFDYPMLKVEAGEYAPATLYVTCVCKLKKLDGSGYVSGYLEKNLPWQATGAGARVLRHPELCVAEIVDGVRGSSGSTNFAASEAQVYLDQVAESYAGTVGEDVSYDGIVPISLDGAIAQVQWRCGLGRASETRASRNHEFDSYLPCFEQRRRLEKTNTVAEMELM